MAPFENHCYVTQPYELTWQEAHSFCLGLGGHVASIGNAEELEFAKTLIQDNFWLGKIFITFKLSNSRDKLN